MIFKVDDSVEWQVWTGPTGDKQRGTIVQIIYGGVVISYGPWDVRMNKDLDKLRKV